MNAKKLLFKNHTRIEAHCAAWNCTFNLSFTLVVQLSSEGRANITSTSIWVSSLDSAASWISAITLWRSLAPEPLDLPGFLTPLPPVFLVTAGGTEAGAVDWGVTETSVMVSFTTTDYKRTLCDMAWLWRLGCFRSGESCDEKIFQFYKRYTTPSWLLSALDTEKPINNYQSIIEPGYINMFVNPTFIFTFNGKNMTATFINCHISENSTAQFILWLTNNSVYLLHSRVLLKQLLNI